jgi:hypothetical protein
MGFRLILAQLDAGFSNEALMCNNQGMLKHPISNIDKEDSLTKWPLGLKVKFKPETATWKCGLSEDSMLMALQIEKQNKPEYWPDRRSRLYY